MRTSLNQKFQKTVNKCDICFEGYDRYYKQPIIICEMHHTICRSCLKSLQQNPKCPICRNKINFKSVVVNNYILQLLPNNPPPPNFRAQLNNLPQPISPPNIPINNFYNNSQIRRSYFNDININNEFIPIDQIQPHNPNNWQQQSNPNNLSFFSTFCNRVADSLSLQDDRKAIYIIIFLFQLPFAILDLYFSKTGTDQACYDKPYRMTFFILRPWLFSVSIASFAIMGAMVLFILLRITGIIQSQCLENCQIAIFAVWAVKSIIWMIVEIQMFTAVIGPHCSGGIYAYGLLQAIIYGITLVVLFGIISK